MRLALSTQFSLHFGESGLDSNLYSSGLVVFGKYEIKGKQTNIFTLGFVDPNFILRNLQTVWQHTHLFLFSWFYSFFVVAFLIMLRSNNDKSI